MPKQQLAAAAYHLKPSEVNKIILATNSFRDRCLIKTLYWAGLRRSEVQNLDIRDIRVSRTFVRKCTLSLNPFVDGNFKVLL